MPTREQVLSGLRAGRAGSDVHFLGWCVSQLLGTRTTGADRSNLEEERTVSAHGSRVQPMVSSKAETWQKGVAVESCPDQNSQEAEREEGARERRSPPRARP